MDQEVFGGDNPESYYDEGLTASMKGDLNRAIECFERAINLDRSMASAYHQLGKCYARLGHTNKAIKLLIEVVKNRPRLVAARVDLGIALTAAGDLKQAKAQFDSVLSARPTDAKALIGLAEVEFAGGNWPGALQYAETALENSGATYPIMFMIGRCAKLVGDEPGSRRALTKATDIIEKYIETNESKPEGHYLLGELAFLQGEFVTALESFRRAEDRVETGRSYAAYSENFSLIDSLARQAQCYERIDRVERAKEIANQIRELNPNHPVCKALLESSNENPSE